MPFSPEKLAKIDRARARPSARGLRDFSVTLLVITTLADDTETTTETPLLVKGQNPRVRQNSARQLTQDALYSERFYEVTLTPEHFSAGYIDSDKPLNSLIYFVVKGPGLPSEGLRCERSSTSITATKATLTLRAIGI